MLPSLQLSQRQSEKRVQFRDLVRKSSTFLSIPQNLSHKKSSSLITVASSNPTRFLSKIIPTSGKVPPDSSKESPNSPSRPKILRYTNYIDKHFPYPSNSTIPNKLCYPGDWDFDLKLILSRINAEDSETDIKDDENILTLADLNNAPSPELFMPIDDKISFTWKEFASTGNESREGASIVRMQNVLILFGGQNRLKHNDVVEFNMTNLEWKHIETCYNPKPRCGHTAVIYKHKMVVYGGCSEYSSRFGLRRCDRKVHVFNTRSLRWNILDDKGKIPKARRNHSVTRVGKSMVIFGGIDKYSKTLACCHVLNLKSKTWKFLGEGPQCLSHCSLTAVYHPSQMDQFNFDIENVPSIFSPKIKKKGIYLYGGLKPDGTIFNELWVLNVSDEPVWKKIETSGVPPIERYNHTAGYVPGYLVIFGGRNDVFYSKQAQLVNDVGVLALDTLTWQKISILGLPPSSRWGHCSCIYDKKIIVFGGMDYKSYMPSNIYYLEVESCHSKVSN